MYTKSGLDVATVTPGGTDSFIHTFPPIIAPLPMTTSPNIVASA
jgi:hypothetical protein